MRGHGLLARSASQLGMAASREKCVDVCVCVCFGFPRRGHDEAEEDGRCDNPRRGTTSGAVTPVSFSNKKEKMSLSSSVYLF